MGYAKHCESVVSKASQTAFVIRRVFRARAPELLRPAFQHYILPICMLASQVWNPSLKKDDNIIERVQRRYTKGMRGMEELTYNERLNSLKALSLHNRRIYADMITVYKGLHQLMDCSPTDLGLCQSFSSDCGNSFRLGQFRSTDSHFCCRVPTQWNKLPERISEAKTLTSFKKLLKIHLMAQNNRFYHFHNFLSAYQHLLPFILF